MTLIYRLSISVYTIGVSIAGLFSKKARLFKQGRQGIFDLIQSANIASHSPIWVHCSSLGEFEQARRIIDVLHEKGEKILLTFFSPSGYEIRKNYPAADWVFYLPIDTPKNAKLFLELTQPKLAIFVKYDLWYYYLKQLKSKSIPSYLISALFHKNQIFFKGWTGKLHREMLSSFDKIYLQNQESKTLLQKIHLKGTEVVGDTRVDSVLERKKSIKKLPILNAFLKTDKAIIVGSAYSPEVDLILKSLSFLQGEKIIIAPHEVDENNIVSIQNKFGENAVRYSLYHKVKGNPSVLILDNIGTLFHSYRYAKLVLIGGGFANGLHNTLEPAAFGVPICFGPQYRKFVEASDMVNLKCAFPIESSNELKSLYSQLQDGSFYSSVNQRLNEYMENSKGASESILNEIFSKSKTGNE